MNTSGPRETREGNAPHVAVVGAGAAGLVAAIFAARAGARTTLVETRVKPGAKIRVSGGGRCNILPSTVRLEDFHTSGSRHAMRNVLFAWPLEEVRRFFATELGVALKTEPTGKVFPASDSSKEVVEALLAECARTGVELVGGVRAAAIQAEGARFRLQLADEAGSSAPLAADRVIVATGGLSLPKTGSDGAGYTFARRFGHTIRATSPALVPLLAQDRRWGDLAGVALPVAAQVLAGSETIDAARGDFLFTHRGFSGPVILDLSRHFTGDSRAALVVGWGESAGRWDELLRAGGPATVASVLRAHLPRRLADRLLERATISEETRLAALPREDRGRLVAALESTPLRLAGDEGYAKAEVTQGGLPLEETRLDGLESRLVPGLHFAGEIFDVTGRVGGFNFLWAWVTGRIAGLAAARERG